MTIIVCKSGSALVTVTGEVDDGEAADFCFALLDAVRVGRPPLEVDLTGVTFMGASGPKAVDDAARVAAPSDRRPAPRDARRRLLRSIESLGIGETLEVTD